MTHNEALEQVQSIFQEVLKRQDIQLEESFTANDVDGWTSLSHMMIISSIEKQFGFRFNFREVMKFKNVGDLCDAIVKKIG